MHCPVKLNTRVLKENILDLKINELNICSYYEIDNFLSLFDKKNNIFSVLNFNIKSFSKNIDKFLSISDSLAELPDILSITETWINRNRLNFSTIPGYTGYLSY